MDRFVIKQNIEYLITLIHNLAAGITNRISTIENSSSEEFAKIERLQTKISNLENELESANSKISQLSTKLTRLETHAITDSLEEGGAK